MRRFALSVIACIPVLLAAQASDSDASSDVRPQAVVQIKTDAYGGAMVRISMEDADYSTKVLLDQIKMIGSYLGSEPRAVQVMPTLYDSNDPKSVIVKASFGITGLVDKNTGVVRLSPIVRALAGVPAPHTISGIFVDFDYRQPTPATLGNFSSSAVRVSRRIEDKSIEYQIQLLTQNPNLIDIPDQPGQTNAVPVAAKPKPEMDWQLDLTLVVGALAGGALVYSVVLLMRPARKSGRRT